MYFIITNFHTEIKPQVKVNHDMNLLAFTQRLINYGHLVKHTGLIGFD